MLKGRQQKRKKKKKKKRKKKKKKKRRGGGGGGGKLIGSTYPGCCQLLTRKGTKYDVFWSECLLCSQHKVHLWDMW